LKVSENWNNKTALVISFFVMLTLVTSIFMLHPSTGLTTPIDASEFIYSTYLGGLAKDLIRDGDIDSEGNIIVTGQTLSTEFPVLNAFQDYFAGGDDDFHTIGGDAFVSKFASDGTLIWSTYLGGTERDSGQSLSLDSAGNIYIVGVTSSPDFPVTNDSMYPNFLGDQYDLFITKMAPDGSLLYSSYFGTNGYDYTEDFEMDNAGNIVIVGSTTGSNLNVTSDAYQSSRSGDRSGFIVRLANDCVTILYSTYFGGSVATVIGSIDIDINNNILIDGYNIRGEFPLTEDAFQSTYDDTYRDFFIAKFNSSDDLVYATFFGGSHMDDSFSVSLDNDGNMYFAGRTWSSDFPVKNAFQTKLSDDNNDSPDAFIAALNHDDGQLKFSSLAGGSGWDTLHYIEVDPYNNVLATGFGGPDGFPIRNAFQTENQGSVDVVLLMVSPTCQPFVCTYFGGSAEDSPQNIILSSDQALIVGYTKSVDLPLSNNSYQNEIGGNEDGFLLKFDYINYLESNGINSRPKKTPGFTIVLFGLGILWLVIKRSK
jgi:hypothetical protein